MPSNVEIKCAVREGGEPTTAPVAAIRELLCRDVIRLGDTALYDTLLSFATLDNTSGVLED